MMGRQDRDQGQLFYEFSLDDMIPTDHLLRRINVFATAVLADLHHQLKAFYSEIGRPSVDPELMIRMLGSAASVRARSCGISSSAWLQPAWSRASSRARGSRWMRA
jgi:transposase